MRAVRKPKLIFILSLPRSGSTLLQRILATHTQIETASEPWLLLPLMYSLRSKGVKSEYGHSTAVRGISSVIAQLPEKEETFGACVRDFVQSLYGELCTEETAHFVDKTPQYYRIIPELVTTFPKGKFIFLFRNPASIVASYLENRYGSLKRIDHIAGELVNGPRLLTEAAEQFKEVSYLVTYEDLTIQTERTIRGLCDYIQVPYQQRMIEQFSLTTIPGTLGDANACKWSSVRDHREKWKVVLNSTAHKRLAKRIVQNWDARYLEKGCYCRQGIISELDKVPVRFKAIDSYHLSEADLFRTIKRLIKWTELG